MVDQFVPLKELKTELKTIENLAATLSNNLRLLSQNIRYIFSQIKNCENIESANYYFHLLDAIQSTLATIVFKDEIDIPDNLRKFTSDFDNLEHVKEYYFKKIKDDQYKF